MADIIQSFPAGAGSGHTILDTDGTAVAQEKNLQFNGLSVTDDSVQGVTEVAPTQLNEDSLNDVCNGSVGTNFITHATNYSTNEQIVGRWIDGKPLYQKTFKYSSGGGDTSWPTQGVYLTTSNNIKNIISCDTTFMWENNWQSAPYYEVENDMDKVFAIVDGTTHNLALFHKIKTVANVDVYVTLQYTKTTD